MKFRAITEFRGAGGVIYRPGSIVELPPGHVLTKTGEHVVQHEGETVACECGRQFVAQISLDQHVRLCECEAHPAPEDAPEPPRALERVPVGAAPPSTRTPQVFPSDRPQDEATARNFDPEAAAVPGVKRKGAKQAASAGA